MAIDWTFFSFSFCVLSFFLFHFTTFFLIVLLSFCRAGKCSKKLLVAMLRCDIVEYSQPGCVARCTLWLKLEGH